MILYKNSYQWSPNGWPLRGQTIGSVFCFLNIPNHNIYELGLDDGWVHPNGCTRDRYRLGHQPVDSIILSDRVGSMYSQATVRKVHDTLIFTACSFEQARIQEYHALVPSCAITQRQHLKSGQGCGATSKLRCCSGPCSNIRYKAAPRITWCPESLGPPIPINIVHC